LRRNRAGEGAEQQEVNNDFVLHSLLDGLRNKTLTKLASVLRFVLTEKLWRKFNEIIAPIDPGMTAGRFQINRIEALFF
jgi:hypothetical protein